MNKRLIIEREDLSLEKEIKGMLTKMRGQLAKFPKKGPKQVEAIFSLRAEIYEDLNQLQHKALIIAAAKRLAKRYPTISKWKWHPKQTSSINEADLTGYSRDKIVINAEVTTSNRPIGTIDQRMKRTLLSLSKKKGTLFYF